MAPNINQVVQKISTIQMLKISHLFSKQSLVSDNFLFSTPRWAPDDIYRFVIHGRKIL